MPALSGRPLRALSEFAHAEFSFPRPDVVSAEIGANRYVLPRLLPVNCHLSARGRCRAGMRDAGICGCRRESSFHTCRKRCINSSTP